MHLYQGTTQQFIGDATQARLASQLADRFFQEFRYRPSPSEVTSWRNSLGAMATVLQLADLTERGILVEVRLPLSSRRLDVLLTGQNPTTGDAAVVVELKQWTEVGRSNITDCVTVDFGGRLVDHLHPSRQVAQYQRYLIDTHPAFSDGAIALDACAYLHYAQHDPLSPLYHASFAELLATNPSFSGDERDAFATFLDERVGGPDDGAILERVAATAFKPHKRLLDHVARVIRNEPAFTLLDEQLVAYNAIIDEVGSAGQNRKSVVFLVEGGPGTGKSVIAVNLVAELAGRGLSTLHVTGSKAFTENLRKIVGGRASALFKYFRDTANVSAPLDVVILDEAHRIRSVSTSRFTPAKARSGKAQIDDILDASRVSVFFIDDLQVVRPGEVGSTDLIRESAAKRGIELRDFKLEAQFRSNGFGHDHLNWPHFRASLIIRTGPTPDPTVRTLDWSCEAIRSDGGRSCRGWSSSSVSAGSSGRKGCRSASSRAATRCTGARSARPWQSAVPPPRKPVESGARRRSAPMPTRSGSWLTEDQEAPRKQRHTARRIWERLVDEQGADVAESTVRRYVRACRRELHLDHVEVAIVAHHEPGEEAQVDFGLSDVFIGGERTQVAVFELRLSHSGVAVHVAFGSEGQEAFLEGHVIAFARLGGVPARIRYDNARALVARVLRGRDRIETERFIALRSHYGFESSYCEPGEKGAHEKGGIEGEVGRQRRRFFVPDAEGARASPTSTGGSRRPTGATSPATSAPRR